MSWRITKDHIAEGDEKPRVGVGGKKFADTILGPGDPLPGDGLPEVQFRMYDDDGELYYEGELHDDDECNNQLAALHFGAADAGCTTIKVKRGNEWVQEIS